MNFLLGFELFSVLITILKIEDLEHNFIRSNCIIKVLEPDRNVDLTYKLPT